MKRLFLAVPVFAAVISSPAYAMQPASDAAPVTMAQAGQHGGGAMHQLGDLMVEAPWARATSQGSRVGGAFLTVRNTGELGDRLVAAESEVADRVQLHMTRMEDGVMQMRQVEGGIDVPAGGVTELKPGSFHVMLMGLKAPLQEGASFPVTLTFERAGSVTIEVPIRAAGAMDDKMTHRN